MMDLFGFKELGFLLCFNITIIFALVGKKHKKNSIFLNNFHFLIKNLNCQMNDLIERVPE